MKFLIRLFILLSIVLLPSCGDINTQPQSGKVSIAYLKSLYKGIPLTITDDISVEGCVISYDRAGEWYKTLVIEDESGGIELKIDETNLFVKYPVGSLVEVLCNNLTLSSYGGVLSLDNISTHITITGQQPPPLTTIRIADLNPRLISCFVTIDSLHFADEEVGERLGTDTAYMNRHLLDNRRDTILLRISPHAEHINYSIPATEGRVNGIISYFNGDYEIILNRISDLLTPQS